MIIRVTLLAAVLAVAAIRPTATHEAPIAVASSVARDGGLEPPALLRSSPAERENVGDLSDSLRDDILPIAPPASSGGERMIADRRPPQQVTPPPERIVAPNAWSGRMLR